MSRAIKNLKNDVEITTANVQVEEADGLPNLHFFIYIENRSLHKITPIKIIAEFSIMSSYILGMRFVRTAGHLPSYDITWGVIDEKSKGRINFKIFPILPREYYRHIEYGLDISGMLFFSSDIGKFEKQFRLSPRFQMGNFEKLMSLYERNRQESN